ncbi:NADP-dependent aryl-alcohol dehydrogenase [Capsulimonas corticalis]|uniref:NADP-dependent aryl-alcohol dehydrogenase n=1 Tax=Capsulimonas corticalis TaxID=2219043 RepID=A0A402CVQ0_9BACT|nr:aldo/keto reductase [Capsulimonas corticalis]BDI30493.1 NADP-dependent aryl-alcohol dehydrogenase [Capsulimonas corticalis]
MSFDRVTLTGTDLVVSSICLGTGGFGTTVPRDEAFGMLDDFLALGGSFIDTAHNYGDWIPEIPRSASERIIGDWMRDRGVRGEIVLATKGAHWKLDAPQVPRLSRQDIQDDLDGSLEALQTDRIDLYWLHRDDPERPVLDILQTLNDQTDAGKIRYFGASNWKPARIAAAQDAAHAEGMRPFSANQLLWNAAPLAGPPYGDPTTAWMDEEAYAYHRRTGLNVIPYQSQAYGLFQRMWEGTLDQMNPGFRGFYKAEESAARYERMCVVMEETGLSITQVTLAYLTSQPFTTVPIVGCRTREQLADCMTALAVRITPAQVRYIEKGERA